MFRILLCALAVLVSACSEPTSSVREITDRDPVTFAGRQPASYPVQGIDASRFQTSLDWKRARKAGVEFAFIKATEGADLKDPAFRQHWRAAGRAGIRRGAYHFYYFCSTPEKQARWFIRNVPRTARALPPVLDMEWNPLSPTCQRRPPGNIVRAEMKVFLDLVEKHYGQRPIIYTTPNFYKDAGLSAMRWEEFWLRSTAKSLPEVYPRQPWTFWQYSATGRLPRSEGDIDLNVFNGTREQWQSWLASRAR